MGTNFYRIPTVDEMEDRRNRLINHIKRMDLSPENIENDFSIIKVDDYNSISPFDEFFDDIKVHLGKRSSGWKFKWNFHDNKYYSNKEELLKFIFSGRVVDEYGTLILNNEFVEMALNWGEPDGLVFNEEYARTHNEISFYQVYDKTIDGLNVSAHTEFC